MGAVKYNNSIIENSENALLISNNLLNEEDNSYIIDCYWCNNGCEDSNWSDIEITREICYINFFCSKECLLYFLENKLENLINTKKKYQDLLEKENTNQNNNNYYQICEEIINLEEKICFLYI